MKSIALEPGSIVHINWEDSCARRGWKYDSDAHGILEPIETFGIVVESTEAFLAISHSKGSDGYMDILSIPYGCIRNIEVINVQSPKGDCLS
jgi:hypothetical protein